MTMTMTATKWGGVAITAMALLIGIDRATAEFTIGPDDLLDIAVWNNTAVSRTVPVRPEIGRAHV